ncbi:MAG: flagellar hook-associated protein FlgL [Planctomycetes bacterium]|nr:flagellar hook-associated protein FlgL [Planctomycetota bacterium]
MAVNPISLSRVSQGLRTNAVASAMQRSQLELYATQTRIATGRSFVTPSDDPVSAARALDLTQALQRQEQFQANIRHGDNTLAAADSAVTELSTLLIEATEIALRDVSNLIDADERAADAELIAGIRQQLQIVGNRQFDGRYLFAGRDTTTQPFVDALSGIAYTGDTGELITRMSDDLDVVINMPGNVLFGALSSRVESALDLTPTLTADTRMEDLRGANGRGVQLAQLLFHEDGGAGTFTVDLTNADTIGDVVTLINEAAIAAGSTLTAALSDTGINITPGGSPLTIRDPRAGGVAAALGIATTEPATTPIVGEPLQPRLTSLTPVEALAGGAAIDLLGGIVITNGERTQTVDFSDAQTVQDIINQINNAGVYVFATINDSGTGIDVFNQVSGTSLSISEGDGTTAGDLGIRTYSAATRLADMNDGLGIGLDEGQDDLRVTAKDGATFDLSLDGALTIGDVIARINAAAVDAGVSVTASIDPTDNGIRLVDATGGDGGLSVSSLNLSTAATDLGLTGSASGTETELVSEDRNPIRTQGILTALLDLEHALRADDTDAISQAAAKLDPLVNEVTRVQGIMGSRSQAMQQKLAQAADLAATTEIFLSELQDLDYPEAVTEMQAALMELQASMQTGSALLSLSLLDYL